MVIEVALLTGSAMEMSAVACAGVAEIVASTEVHVVATEIVVTLHLTLYCLIGAISLELLSGKDFLQPRHVAPCNRWSLFVKLAGSIGTTGALTRLTLSGEHAGVELFELIGLFRGEFISLYHLVGYKLGFLFGGKALSLGGGRVVGGCVVLCHAGKSDSESYD